MNVVERVTVVKFGVDSTGSNGTGCFRIKARTHAITGAIPSGLWYISQINGGNVLTLKDENLLVFLSMNDL